MALVAATAARASTKRASFLRMTVLLQGKRVFRQPADPCLRLILLLSPSPKSSGRQDGASTRCRPLGARDLSKCPSVGQATVKDRFAGPAIPRPRAGPEGSCR